MISIRFTIFAFRQAFFVHFLIFQYTNNLEHIVRIVAGFVQVFGSQTIGFQNPKLLLFMLIGPYRDSLHYLPDLDAIVVIEPAEDAVRIHDIIGRFMPTLASIEGFLARFQAQQIDFLFSPDQLGPVETTDLPLVEDTLMTSADFRMPADTLFPFSIRA